MAWWKCGHEFPISEEACSQIRAWCPLSEVRAPLPRSRSRTSESYGHQQIYDSSAPFDLKSLSRTSPQMSQGLQIGGTSGVNAGNLLEKPYVREFLRRNHRPLPLPRQGSYP